MNKKYDLTGKCFGRFKVVKFVGRDKTKKHTLWKCKCECGKIKICYANDLKSGKSLSCGCLRKELVSKSSFIHGFSRDSKYHSFYQSWASMKKRCNLIKNINYKNYGGRGIGYDLRWEKFLEFKKDMFFKYLYALKQLRIKQPSLERINVNSNYCFDNCIFIEWSDQGKNRRRWFKAISPNGDEFISKDKFEFAKNFNLNVRLINRCLEHKGYRVRSKWKFNYVIVRNS